jgi:DNA-binding Xre family transcriptional regulator
MSSDLSYFCLWRNLIVISAFSIYNDEDDILKEGDLCCMAGISRSTASKLTNGETVTTEAFLRICNALECDTSDITEMIQARRRINK